MQTISVYLNQRASNTSFEFWKSRITKSLFRSELNFRTPGSLTELHEELDSDIKNNVDAIVSVGGDGTVNTLIQSMAGTDVGLLVIPGGTANDLAHELGTEKNLKKVIQTIRAKQTKNIDLIKINGRYMATNGGIGFGGHVAEKINDIRRKFPIFKKIMKLSGKKIYSIFIAQELMGINLEYYNLKLKSNEFTGQTNCSALLINNQPVLAGTFKIAPETLNNDGKFNVTILSHPNRQRLIQCMLTVASGNLPVNDPYFQSFETDSLEIENLNPEKEVPFFGDGEVFDNERQKWNITVSKNALKVYSLDPNNDLVDLVNEVSLR